MSLRIAPSVLDADPLGLAQSLRMLEEGGASWLHLDVMDGHFVPNLTFGPMFAQAIGTRTRLPMEAHLMVSRPETLVIPFVHAGVKRIIVHPESTAHIMQILKEIRESGASPGAVINPGTPVTALSELLPYIDMVLVMSVNPGWGGQKFIPTMMEKIRRVRTMIDDHGRDIDLEVDGGVNRENLVECARAGANLFVVGSGIFRAPDPAGSLRELVALEPG